MKVGIYGGSFNPIHKEHQNIIIASFRELNLDKVVLVPTSNPPHKNEIEVPFSERVNMLNEVYKDIPFVEINQIENENEETSYAYDTIKKLQKEYGEVIYIIGEDSLKNIETWYKWEKLLKLCPFCIVQREGVDLDIENTIERYTKKYGAKFTILKYKGKLVSSTKIRALLKLNRETNCYLDESVKSYIKKHKIYSEYHDLISKIEEAVSFKTFKHICSTAFMGLKINSKCNLKLDSNKVLLACLFHDIAKERNDLKYGVPLDTIGTPIYHQYYGERVANIEYGIKDEEILDAIKFHTSARPEMTTLGKLVYVADMICEGRDYDGVEDLRQKVFENFEKGFYACLEGTYNHVLKQNKGIYPLTVHAVNYYKKENL